MAKGRSWLKFTKWLSDPILDYQPGLPGLTAEEALLPLKLRGQWEVQDHNSEKEPQQQEATSEWALVEKYSNCQKKKNPSEGRKVRDLLSYHFILTLPSCNNFPIAY